jgi:hypothetical protein
MNLPLIRPDSFYERLRAGGLIWFGEAFMAGDWVSVICRVFCP